MSNTRLDLRGLKCPLPALKTRKALARLKADDILIVACTDPLAEIDIPHVVAETGHILETATRDGDAFVFRIRTRAQGDRGSEITMISDQSDPKS